MGANLSGEVPKTMKRLVLVQGNEDLTKAVLKVEEVAVPHPKSGQVLIRVVAAPVNPSDYGMWRRDTADQKGGGRPIGNEGSGVVVSSGGGFVANSMVGKSVGFVNLPKGNGAYSEYVVATAMTSVFPLPDNVPVENACSFFVNPYTAYGIVDTAKARGSHGLVHTAAASQVGQMLVKYCKDKPVALINVVRRQEQADIVTALGAKLVVVTDDNPLWKQQLKQMIEENKVSTIFDAIGGDMAGDLVSILPDKGTYFVYGVLSGKGLAGIGGIDMIYRKCKVEGWFLPSWIDGFSGSQISTVMNVRAASAAVLPALQDGWSSTLFTDCTIDTAFDEFVKMFTTNGFTNKKLRICFPKKAAVSAVASTAPAVSAVPSAAP